MPLLDFGVHRFENVVFVRTEESVNRHSAMQSKNGFVEVIMVEVNIRERIGHINSKSGVMFLHTRTRT